MGRRWVSLRDHPLCLIYWYAAVTVFVVATHEAVIRRDFVEGGLRSAYSAFCGFSVVLFFVVVGPLLFAAEFRYKDAAFADKRSGVTLVATSAWFLLSDSPLFVLNLLLYLDVGMVEVPQGVSTLLTTASWFCGFSFVWFRFVLLAARLVHYRLAKAPDGGWCDGEIGEALCPAPAPAPAPASQAPAPLEPRQSAYSLYAPPRGDLGLSARAPSMMQGALPRARSARAEEFSVGSCTTPAGLSPYTGGSWRGMSARPQLSAVMVRNTLRGVPAVNSVCDP